MLLLPLEPGEVLPLTPVAEQAEVRGLKEGFGTQGNELLIEAYPWLGRPVFQAMLQQTKHNLEFMCI